MAPEVGLEPTTLRLTASEFPSPSPAIVCCKSLYSSKLENTASTVDCYRYCLIATDFERVWAHKWVQSFQSLFGSLRPSSRFAGNAKAVGFYETLQIENAGLYGALLEQSHP